MCLNQITTDRSNNKLFWHLFIVIVVFTRNQVKSSSNTNEYFTSVTGLETLMKTEQTLLIDLKQYVIETRQQINLLEKEISKISKEHDLASENLENYLANPVNAYKLIKRLMIDWEVYEEHIAKVIDFLKLIDERRNNLSFPELEDFHESALALIRLQKTYQLTVPDVAAGKLNGIKYGYDMTWTDCLVLGQQLFHMKAYNQTKIWLQESVKRLQQDNDRFQLFPAGFLQESTENLIRLGDMDTALHLYNVMETNHKEENKIKEMMQSTEILEEPDNDDENILQIPYHKSAEFELYEKVCRGEVTQTPKEQRDLRCYYVYENCPFCRLAPFKVEDLNLDPEVKVFHNILSEKAIETIKALASPHLIRSTVFGSDGVGAEKHNYRISKNAWLPYDSHSYLIGMLRDIHDITGLDMTYSEQLQVANYGLGGHYEPHFDFFKHQLPEEVGNRISTAIFYLSDIEQGGATAFPFLKIAVKPLKGSVLFWYNLHRSLHGDYRTKHGACPVLKGSKWIANVWTHERRQEFIRPCALHQDHEISLPYHTIK
uniref:procollagen-proline 4-dioxygenase n=1 Tax=Glossina brevipalpis TaxID=37001 RepID=A0A1A9WN35_9MUSC